MQESALSSVSWLPVAVTFGLLELLLQLMVMRHFSYQPIGDEIEYIERGQSTNPYRFHLFHRLPVLPTVARLGALTPQPVTVLRLTSVFLGAAAIAATAGAATHVGGPVIAIFLCLLLLLMPERIVLCSRIWPDVYLAAATSGIALILTLTPSPIGDNASAVLTGLLVAFAVLVRLDALVLIPAAAMAWGAVNGLSHPNSLVFLVGPPVATILGWWLISKTCLGENWPDTTWRFNLGVAVQDALANAGGGTIVIDDLIEGHRSRILSPSRQHSDITPSWTAHIRSMLSRLRAMVGPDTFVSGNLLANHDHGRLAPPLLRFSTPLLIGAAIVAVAWRPNPSTWLALPSLALLVSPILFHARTRYRLPVIFGLIPSLAGCLNVHLSGPHSALSLILGVSAVAAITALLARKPRRLE